MAVFATADKAAIRSRLDMTDRVNQGRAPT